MNKYESVRPLGYGGFGKIQLLRNIETGKMYAAKFASYMNARETNSEYRILYFFAYIFAPEVSPAVELFDSFNYENSRVLFLYYYRFDFRGLQKAHVFDLIYLKQFVFVVNSLVRSIAQMHALGVVHRDLKSANVLLDDTGKSRIADFGLAKVELGHACTDFSSVVAAVGSLETCIDPYRTRTVCTLLYRSPEQLFAFYRQDGKRVEFPLYTSAKKYDLFSLGVIIAEVLINHFFIALEDSNEQACEQALKMLYLQLYGKDLVKMVAECFQIDQTPYEFILQHFETQRQEEATKLLQKDPENMEVYFRTLIELRFGAYCFGTMYKHLDTFCAACGALLSCVPSRRKSIQFCSIFRYDQQNIISALPESALDAGTEVNKNFSLYVYHLQELGGTVDFSGSFRCNALTLKNAGALCLGVQYFKTYRDYAHYEQTARGLIGGYKRLK